LKYSEGHAATLVVAAGFFLFDLIFVLIEKKESPDGCSDVL
jgi:hypothetical protein